MVSTLAPRDDRRRRRARARVGAPRENVNECNLIMCTNSFVRNMQIASERAYTLLYNLHAGCCNAHGVVPVLERIRYAVQV